MKTLDSVCQSWKGSQRKCCFRSLTQSWSQQTSGSLSSIPPSLGFFICVCVCVCVCMYFSKYIPCLRFISIWLIPRFFSRANHNLTKFHRDKFPFMDINSCQFFTRDTFIFGRKRKIIGRTSTLQAFSIIYKHNFSHVASQIYIKMLRTKKLAIESFLWSSKDNCTS